MISARISTNTFIPILVPDNQINTGEHRPQSEHPELDQALEFIITSSRRMFSRADHINNVIDDMLIGLLQLTQASHAQILLRRGSTLKVLKSSEPGDVGAVLDIDKCVCGLAIKKNCTITSGDVTNDYPDLYQRRLGLDLAQPLNSEVAVPIHSPAVPGFVSGVLNIEAPKHNAFSQRTTHIVEQFALQAGAALQNARERAGLRLTLDLAERVQGERDLPKDALRDTLHKVAAYLHAEVNDEVRVQFLVHHPETDLLVVHSSTVAETEGIRLRVRDSFSGLAVGRRESVRSGNAPRDYPHLFKDTVGDANANAQPTLSELAVPVKESGLVIGVINVESPSEDAFTEYDEYLMQLIAANAGIWTNVNRVSRNHALEKMAAVGNAAAHLVHLLGNELLDVSWMLHELDKPQPTPQAEEKRALLGDRLRRRFADIEKRLHGLRDSYRRALTDGPVDVAAVIPEAVQRLVTDPRIDCKVTLDPDVRELHGVNALSDVVWNLVTNAKQAIPVDQSGRIEVTTRAIRGQYTNAIERVELIVADTGRGMSPDQLARARDFGYSSRNSTGFGLWWVNMFVESCGGGLELDSEPGRGTTVRVWIPWTAKEA